MNLQEALYSSAYRNRLRDAYADLISYASLHDRPSPAHLGKQPGALTRLLVDYVQDLYESGGTLQQATHAVLSVQKAHTRCRHKLSTVWDSIASWRMVRPSRPRLPITQGMMQGIVAMVWAAAAAPGCAAPLRHRIAGVLLWLGFECLLRPGEILGLKAGDISIGTRLLMTHKVSIITIQNPKNRRYMGRKPFVLCTDHMLVDWLAWTLTSLSPDTLIMEGGRSALVQIFNQALTALDMQDLGITLASLRTGGATQHFIQYENIGKLQYLGRWRNAQTLEHYLQEAMAAHVDLALSQRSRARTEAARQIFLSLKGPPAVAWWALGSRRWRATRRSRK